MAWVLKTGKVDLTGALTLIVGRLHGENVSAWRLEVSDEVEEALRAQCSETVSAFAKREPVQYGPDVLLGPEADEKYLALGGVKIGRTDAGAPAGVEIATSILSALRDASTLETIHGSSLPGTRFTFYAVLIGDDPRERFAFVRKKNPVKVSKKSWVAYLDRRLQKLQEPLFVFDYRFDILIGGGGLAALNQAILEQLFRDHSAISGRFPLYVEAVTSVLPIDEDGADALKAKCSTNAQIARKMRAIYESGHLSSHKITIPKIRAYAVEHGIKPTDVVRNGKLYVNGSNATVLLKLLNEDLFTGSLTRRKFEANGKVVLA